MAEGESIQVILKNDALGKHTKRLEGIYKESETVNGRRSWKSSTCAIWFLPNNRWGIGPLNIIGRRGKYCSIISAKNTGDSTYPYDVPNDKWSYFRTNGFKKPADSANIIIKSVKDLDQNSDSTTQKSAGSKNHTKLLKNLKDQFLKDEFSDVKIICNGKIFDCHKFILLCQSDFFKGLFSHEKSEEITIHETSAETMERILFFMYHDSMDKSNIDIELLQAADRFLMEDLVAICIEHLKSNLTLDNALDTLIIAYQINQNSLQDAAVQFVLKNRGKLKTEKWNEMIRNHPDLIAKCLSQVFIT